jgi:hypothetical protein
MRCLACVSCRAAIILTAVAIAADTLAGCTDPGPMKIGKDTYRISARVPFNGPSGAKGEALLDANEFCAKLSRQMLLYNVHSYQCPLYEGCAEAVIYFLCLTEDDPRYQAQYQHGLDEGVSIIENR